MIFLYPLRPNPLVLILAVSWMVWLLANNLILFLIGLLAYTVIGFAFSAYLFAVLERSADGYPDSPAISISILRPLTEARPLQLVIVSALIYALSARLWAGGYRDTATLVIVASLAAAPAFIGLLGINEGLLRSLNPVYLARFILRTGLSYVLMMAMLIAGYALGANLYRSSTGLFGAVFFNAYCLVLLFHWLGRLIHGRREQLGYQANITPEREARRRDDAIIRQRKLNMERVYQRRRQAVALPILLACIEAEAEPLAAHAWYHAELMNWDNRRLALKHAPFYIRALRGAGKQVLADLIERECTAIDPGFTPG